MAEWPTAGILYNRVVSGLSASRCSSGSAKSIFNSIGEISSSRVTRLPEETRGEQEFWEEAEHLEGLVEILWITECRLLK